MPDEQIEQTADSTADSDAGFEQGFNEQRNNGVAAKPEEPKPEVKEPVVEEVPATPEAVETPPEEKPDAFADLKSKFESVESRLSTFEKVTDRLRNVEGHIGNINSQLKTALATAKAVEKSGGQAPTQAQVVQAAADPEKWKRMKEDFPDLAEALDERFASLPKHEAVDVDGIKSQITSDLAQQIAGLKAEAARAKVEAAQARQFAAVDAKHPDWEEAVKSPEFKTWFATQTPEVKALASSPVARDAIQMIDAFKASQVKQPAQQAENAQRLARAVTPRGTPAKPATLNDEDAFESGFKEVRSG